MPVNETLPLQIQKNIANLEEYLKLEFKTEHTFNYLITLCLDTPPHVLALILS